MSENLEIEREAAVDTYLDREDWKKKGINLVREETKKDLMATKEKWIFGKLWDNLKQAAFKNVATKLDIQVVEYNRIELRMLKDLLKKAETKQQLDFLKQQISAGKNIADITLDKDTSPSQSPVDSSSRSPSVSSSEALIVAPSTVALSSELQKIRETIEVKKSFAKIKKVKNADGKVILECTAKTPYINEKALNDVLWLADAFFKKTGKPLSLNSVYRTIDHQKELKKKNTVPTAEPGKSWHNLGLSMDINDGDRYEKAIGWIQGFRDLAKQYHFNPIASEDWHFDHDTLSKKPTERLNLAQSLDHEFQEERLAA